MHDRNYPQNLIEAVRAYHDIVRYALSNGKVSQPQQLDIWMVSVVTLSKALVCRNRRLDAARFIPWVWF